MVAALMSRVEIERFLDEIGGEAAEMPRLTREVVIPREGRGPLIMLPAGQSTIARRRAIASSLLLLCLDTVDWGSAVACWRAMFAADARHFRPADAVAADPPPPQAAAPPPPPPPADLDYLLSGE